MQRLDGAGSTEYAMTWKGKATPSRRRYCQLAASGRRTSAIGFSGWPSPQAHDVRKRGNTEADHHHFPHDLSNAAELTGWATPAANEFEPRDVAKMEARRARLRVQKKNGNGFGLTLGQQVSLAGWPTPTTADESGHGSEYKTTATHHQGTTLNEAVRKTLSIGEMRGQGTLVEVCYLRQPRVSALRKKHADAPSPKRTGNLTGPPPSLSTAATESIGASRLNPGFSLWMQLGTELCLAYLCCAPPATQSSRKLRLSLSER
jgi:hypothetical protein